MKLNDLIEALKNQISATETVTRLVVRSVTHGRNGPCVKGRTTSRRTIDRRGEKERAEVLPRGVHSRTGIAERPDLR